MGERGIYFILRKIKFQLKFYVTHLNHSTTICVLIYCN